MPEKLLINYLGGYFMSDFTREIAEKIRKEQEES